LDSDYQLKETERCYILPMADIYSLGSSLIEGAVTYSASTLQPISAIALPALESGQSLDNVVEDVKALGYNLTA
jgi:hypothetical protein